MASAKGGPPDEAVMKQRIISHMNADHQDSLVRYLEHHHRLSSFTARDAQLTDLDLQHLALRASNRTYTIPFSPPLSSLKETRERVVAMDAACITALGRSDITIREYVAPDAIQTAILLASLAGYFGFSYRAQYEPGNLLYEVLWVHLPGVAEFLRQNANLGLGLMVGIHGTEAVLMHFLKMRKHSVPTGSAVWWKWEVSNFLEGAGAFIRVNKLVRKKQAEKAKRQH